VDTADSPVFAAKGTRPERPVAWSLRQDVFLPADAAGRQGTENPAGGFEHPLDAAVGLTTQDEGFEEPEFEEPEFEGEDFGAGELPLDFDGSARVTAGRFEGPGEGEQADEAQLEEAEAAFEGEREEVTGPVGENALQPGEATRWVPIVDGRVRALFHLSGPGLAGRVRFLDQAGFAAAFPRDDLVGVLVNQFSLPVADHAGTPIESILRHHHMADFLEGIRDENLIRRRLAALRTFIRERIRVGAFLQSSPFGEIRHPPRALVAQLIGGFTTTQASRSGRHVLVQVPTHVEVLVHEACHFYAAAAFNEAIRNRARDRVFVGMLLSEILAEGMAELFAREVMRGNAATLGPIQMSAYQAYVEAAGRFVQTAGEQHARAAYFDGNAAAINRLFRAIDLNIRDYPLMVPAFMLSLPEQEEFDGAASTAFDNAGTSPEGETQTLEVEEVGRDELEANREAEGRAEWEDSETDAAEDSWELEELNAQTTRDPSETEYEAEWEFGERQVAPEGLALARTSAPLTINSRLAGRRPVVDAAKRREVLEWYEAEFGEPQVAAPHMLLRDVEVGLADGAGESSAVVEEAVPLEWQAAHNAVATRLTVTVRTDFTVRKSGRVEFDWRPGEPVDNAQVAVVGTPIAAVTSPRGVAVLDMTGLPDGDHLVRLSHTQRDRSTTDPAGPAVADQLPARPPRIYRILDVRIRTVGGLLRAAWIAPGDTHGGIGNRTQSVFSQDHLPIDWKPVWMRSPMKHTEAMRAANAIDLVIVHGTGGPRIGPAINTFLNQNSVTNAHYVIDHDGHVVKTAEDLRRANQAGTSSWRGRIGLNGSSIGIEIVNDSGPFPAAQYTSLLLLLQQLRASYPTIPRHRIVGHSDIATTSGQPSLLSDRRAEDPGGEFDWATLERHALGMAPISTDLGNYYTGIFSGALGNAPIALRRGDRDFAPNSVAIIGGVRRPGFTGTPVRELQEDLEHIGYSVRPAGGAMGTFNLHTERAVDRFQRHFFAGTRKMFRVGRMGRVDALTANWIKAVHADIP
jgi:N-acetyl-anhydromuramyl-L-alanine amidase AmpD